MSIAITKDGITNNILAEMDFALAAFPVAEGWTHKQLKHVEPEPVPPTNAETAQVARDWRNAELKSTDYIVPLSDHPSRTATMTYRAALRDWPSTSDFPATKPTLG